VDQVKFPISNHDVSLPLGEILRRWWGIFNRF
jgi:hypothetical protein